MTEGGFDWWCRELITKCGFDWWCRELMTEGGFDWWYRELMTEGGEHRQEAWGVHDGNKENKIINCS